MALPDRLPSYDELPEFEGLEERHAWEVFGPNDDLGTINLLTPERVLAASKLIRRGAVINVSLSLDLPSPGMFSGRPAYTHHREITRGGSDDSVDGFQMQGSSQWDGLRHVRFRDRGFYQGLQDDDVRSPGRIGIEHWAKHGIFGRGILIDMYRHGVDGGYDGFTRVALDGPMMERIAQTENIEIREGDIVLIRTGWQAKYRTLDQAGREALVDSIRGEDDPQAHHCAGLDASKETAAWIWNHHVAALAADNPALEALPVMNREFQHRRIIPMFGMPIGEFWDLEDLAEDCAQDGVYEFFFASSPLDVPGAAGSPINAHVVK